MVYQKPIGILASGNTLWNTWRQEYANAQATKPDLHGADLHQAHLCGIDFHAAAWPHSEHLPLCTQQKHGVLDHS